MLQQEYHKEYKALTKEEKDDLIEEFNTHKQEDMKIHHPTACAHIQDVANSACNM